MDKRTPSTGSSLGGFVRICLGATVITSFANALWLTSVPQGARLVETGYYSLHPLLRKAGVDGFLHWLPEWMWPFRRLESWNDFSGFVPLAAAANVPLNAILASAFWLLTVVLVALRLRWWPRESGGIRSAGLTAVLLGPILLLPANDWLHALVTNAEGLSGLLAWSNLYALTIVAGVILAGWFLLTLLARFRPNLLDTLIPKAGVAIGALAVVTWFAGWVARPAPPSGADGPNVLLISIDSLRADHVHSYGYPRDTSPNLDRVASEGVLFQTAVAPTSWTLPSHMSLLTGLDALHHGVVSDYVRLSPEIPTLAEMLRGGGYATAGFTVAAYVSARWGFSRGFDSYHDYGYRIRRRRGGSSPALVGYVRSWIDGWDRGGRERPFFIFLHLFDVHHDYDPPAPYYEMFDPDYKGTVTGDDFMRNRTINRDMDRRDLEHIVARYDGEIRYTDEHLGTLFDHLRQLGEWDNTVVAVTADHGDEFFEHGWKGHRKTLYDEVLLVPLIIRYPPRLPQGVSVETQVRLIDVAPTLLSLSGVRGAVSDGPVRSPYDARDLTPIMLSASSRPPRLLAFSHLSEVFIGNPGPLLSMRTDNEKFLINEGNEKVSNELYDLTADPGEQQNLAGGDHPLVAQLSGILERWKLRYRGRQRGRHQMSAAEQDELKALGYIQ